MLIDKLCINEFNIEVYNSIKDIDADTWNKALSQGHPFKTHSFMTVCEQTLSHREYRYFQVFASDSASIPLGLFFATQEAIDLTNDSDSTLQSYIRIFCPKFGCITVAMLGSYETSGRHWWFSHEITLQKCVTIMSHSLALSFPHVFVRIIRDIEHSETNYAELHSQLLAQGFNPAMNYPLALIALQGRSWEQHSQSLKSNCRKILNRIKSQFHLSEWRIVHYSEQTIKFECFYKQYINTHRRASEYKRKALPLSFFEQIQKQCPVVVSVLYDKQDRVRSFILSGISENVINPFVFGRDYHEESEVNAYYILHMDLIQHFSHLQTQVIDLGITNYFVKQNLGAYLLRNDIYLRFRNPLFNSLFGRILSRKFGITQPKERRVFKNDYKH
ncbi:hypothetical protein ID850_11295 [Xenorhabdus sp. Flor]|uniref:hypothetical protein n=1 Tax=Xenorhabdus cabanillasii TaxID=351673 RepID=UPI0019C606C8|nr:hypothetical protein [Xenorhabdus sp. Flor]MBD2815342.1 hypothetical protein [Xenorhabdus sp. Flor]